MSALSQFSTYFTQPSPTAPENPRESISLEQVPRKHPHRAPGFRQWVDWEESMTRKLLGEHTSEPTFEVVDRVETMLVRVEETNRYELSDDLVLAALDTLYIIENRAAVAHFIRANRLDGLLLQAREPLRETFGDVTKTLSLMCDDEGFEILFCTVMTPATVQDARNALAEFDNRWWVDHSGPVAGKLNFDFELI